MTSNAPTSRPTFTIRDATVVDGTIGGLTRHADVHVIDGLITDHPANEAPVIDAHGAPVTPGYIDIHCHGAAGHAYDDGPEAISAVLDAHLDHGTTRAVMSLVTDSVESMAETIRRAVPVIDATDPLLGIHPEGPFLDPGHKGAHPEDLLCDPSAAAIDSLLEAAQGHLAQVTLAPERAGGIDAVRALVSAGVVASVGHTNSDFETARAAFDAGATILTHAFNAMNGIHHRAPGPIIAALRDESVWLELINDGIHVHPAVARSLFLEAPDRMILITDAMSATCNPDGAYRLGHLDVTVRDGVARLTDGTSLAGSTLTMDRAVANAAHSVGVGLDVAVAAATSHPAAALGLGDKLGRIAPGYPADLLLLDEDTLLPRRIFTHGVEHRAAPRTGTP